MKVLAGRLAEQDRAIIFESNREGRRILVATLEATVTYDQRRATPYEVAPMQAVGAVLTWEREWFEIGSVGFRTRIPWTAAVKVWRRDDAPPEAEVDALIAEHSVDPLDDQDQAVS